MPNKALLDPSLVSFLPEVQEWFRATLGTPTAVQRQAWPAIQSGLNCLICAPTGSGKTLAAFLWSINRMLKNRQDGEREDRILYVSPMKALNSDIEVNLRSPLRQLRERTGTGSREIRVAVRSGDTGSAERRRQDRERPDIFITTPESLAILMSRPVWPPLLQGIATVIVDEVHSLVENKRGALLIALLELLEHRNGPFQRLALSATVNPVETVGAWFSGREPHDETGVLRPRPLKIVAPPGDKRIELEIDRPENGGKGSVTIPGSWLRERMAPNRGVLLFANSRRQVERTAVSINQATETDPLVSVHHGSLAREIRKEVEEGFRRGEIKGVVATHSLELGIDIGTVDQVILLGTPMGVASALQRIGRSGHRVDAVSRGLLVPRYRLDHIYGLILSDMALQGELEPVWPLEEPLDVLAQLLLIFLAAGLEQVDEMKVLLRRSSVFQRLNDRELYQTLEMLAGRISARHHPSLVARIHYHPQDGRCTLRPHARILLYRAAGVIADRGTFSMRQEDNQVKIGELDEEFVWERNIGDIFPFANRLWRISRRDSANLYVTPHQGGGGIVPFWRAEATDRSPLFCERVLSYFEAQAEARDPIRTGKDRLRCSPQVTREIDALLWEQRKSWNCLPSRRRVILECYGKRRGIPQADNEILLFTFRGGRFNRTLAVVLEWLFLRKTGNSLHPLCNNEGLILRTDHALEALTELFKEMEPLHLAPALRDLLPGRSESASLFREQAQIAMLIPRSMPGQRGPLWWRRERSSRLMEELGESGDCPLLENCWKETLTRHYEPEAVREWLGEWQAGKIELRIARLSSPSPMAGDLIWLHENEMMYQPERAEPGARPSWGTLNQAGTGLGMASVSQELSDRYFHEKWRLLKGMEPDSLEELSLWIGERRFVPLPVWNQMAEAVERRNGALWREFGARVYTLCRPDGEILGYCDSPRTVLLLSPAENAGEERGLSDFLLEWLRFFPSLNARHLSGYWGWDLSRAQELAASLPEELVCFRGEDSAFCLHRVNQQLWQRSRREKRQGLSAADAPRLSRFLFHWQTRRSPDESVEDRLGDRLFRFLSLPLKKSVWLGHLLPALCPEWDRDSLQRVISRHGLLIRSDSQSRIAFILPDDPAGMEKAGELSLEPRELDLARVMEKSIGEVSSHDLLQSGLASTHGQALEMLKNLFCSGWIACSRIEGVECLPEFPSGAANESGPVTGPYRGNRYGGRMAKTPMAWNVSRGWRRLLTNSFEGLSPLERRETAKEWIRLLMERYGLFFPELLQHEWLALPWSELRSALSQMEWAGELISGYFVRGARTPQYLLPQAADRFSERGETGWQLFHSSVPWSLCGYDKGLFRNSFPFPRHFGWLVCEGGRWGAAVSESGRTLRLNSAWSSEELLTALQKIVVWVGKARPFPGGQWILDRVQAESLTPGQISSLLKEAGFVREMDEWVMFLG